MKIYVMGNSLVEVDSLPVKLLPRLKKEFPEHEFIELDPSEDFPKQKEVVIIDTIINAKKVVLINDIDKIITEKVYSLHDFDLGYNLKLMKKFGLVEKVSIIGLPPDISQDEAIKNIKRIITSLS